MTTPSSARPFDEILMAWKQGRPIVPLFGAGISVESGIPVTARMVSYLSHVSWRVGDVEPGKANKRSKAQKRSRIVAYLNKHGWPEPHDFSANTLHYLSTNASSTAPNTLDEVEKCVREASGLSKSGNYWRLLLNDTTDAFQDLKDSFFDRLEIGRSPSTCHQFAHGNRTSKRDKTTLKPSFGSETRWMLLR